ncbi:Transcription initiation factor IID, subunit [Aphelenchoides fujianensis]|nr:Transcription initiation factor IID, subunit [Aphelenchoides fujianensis]
MAAEAEAFDSGDEETPEEAKRTPEERKQIFRRELAEPRADTLEQLETVVLAYVQQLCQRALHVGKAGRLGLEDVYYFIRRDPKKYARVRELLSLSEELKRARKPFEQMKELSD